MFETKSSERWLFYFLHFSIAAAGSASGSSTRVIGAGERKEKRPSLLPDKLPDHDLKRDISN